MVKTFNYEVIFPHLVILKRCSIICANLNKSPLETVNNTELFKKWKKSIFYFQEKK